MKNNRFKKAIRIILTVIGVTVFLLLCGFFGAVQIVWHDLCKYFDSSEKVGYVFGGILLLVMFGYLLYGIGFVKGIKEGIRIQQDPNKYKEFYKD